MLRLLRLHLRRKRVVQNGLQGGEEAHVGDGRHQRRTAHIVVLLLLVQLLRSELRLLLRRVNRMLALLILLLGLRLRLMLILLLIAIVQLLLGADIRVRCRQTLALRLVLVLVLVMGRPVMGRMRLTLLVVVVMMLLRNGRCVGTRRVERRRVRVVRIGGVLRGRRRRRR